MPKIWSDIVAENPASLSGQLQKYWEQYKLPYETGEQCRLRAKTDLFYLAKALCGCAKMTEKTHKEICDFFVKKDPSFKSFEEFANQYPGNKERTLLVPRGGFKSVINVCDCVQYILCWPDIQMMIMTGKGNLATGFVRELKNYFVLRDDGTPATGLLNLKPNPDGKPSLLQILFPEYCLLPKETGNQDEFQCPLIPKGKQATVTASGVESANVGWHYDVLKCDDVVTDQNFGTAHMLEQIRMKVSIINATMHPYGFFDKVGTWYHENDLYGIDVKAIESAKRSGEPCTIELLLRAAMKARPEAVGKSMVEMGEADWELWFPEQLTYKFLMNKKRTDPWFSIKYMNDPRGLYEVKFPREKLVNATKPWTQFPNNPYGIFQAWDTAYTGNIQSDYSVGVTGMFAGGRIYILAIQRGKWDAFTLPQIIAAEAKKWNTMRVVMEDSLGQEWLVREVKREMQKMRHYVSIELRPRGNSKKFSKSAKAEPLARLIGDSRLFFSTGIDCLPAMYDELEKFGNGASTNDDIVDALAIFCNHYSQMVDVRAADAAVLPDPEKNKRAQRLHNLMHLEGEFAHMRGIPHNESELAQTPSTIGVIEDYEFLGREA